MTRREFFKEYWFRLQKYYYGYCDEHKTLRNTNLSARRLQDRCAKCEVERRQSIVDYYVNEPDRLRNARILEMKEAILLALRELEREKCQTK